MLENRYFINVVNGLALKHRDRLINPLIAVCFEVYTEKLNDEDDDSEVLVLNTKGTHIHSAKVWQVTRRLSYGQLRHTPYIHDMCKYFVNDAFNEMERFLNNDLWAAEMHLAKEDNDEH